jgi:hypothetical protein
MVESQLPLRLGEIDTQISVLSSLFLANGV